MHLLPAAVVLAAVAAAVVAEHIDPVAVDILDVEADSPAAAAVVVGSLAAEADNPDVAAAVVADNPAVAVVADNPAVGNAVVADLVVGIALVGLADCNHTY